MNNEYIKEQKIEERTDEEKNEELIRSVIDAKVQLNNANINYEYAENDLIDYYSYQIKALQSKVDYLTKKIKKRGIELDISQRARLIKNEENEAVWTRDTNNKDKNSILTEK